MGRARFRTAAAIAMAVALFHASSPARVRARPQPPTDEAMIAAIKAEATRRSEAAKLFHTLTDAIGPRLTGSPAHVAAARWAMDRFRDWGLTNPRLEPFEFGRGWSLDKLAIEMIAPRYMPLIGYAEAWSPSTGGVLTGKPVYIGDSTAEEIDRLGTRVRGAIVLTHRLQAEFLRADRPQPAVIDGPVQTGNPPLPEPSSAALTQQILARLQTHGAGVALRPGAMEHGTVRVQGNRNTTDTSVPSVVLAAEHYNMLVRLVQSGVPVELRVAVAARFIRTIATATTSWRRFQVAIRSCAMRWCSWVRIWIRGIRALAPRTTPMVWRR
jgi:carboxypeptidase Q